MTAYLKLFFGACVLLLFVSLSCWLWYNWQVSSYRDEIGASALVSENHGVEVLEEPSTETDHVSPESVDDAEASSTSVLSETSTDQSVLDSDVESVNTPDGVAKPASVEVVDDTPVSPFGFGKYPQIPDSWPRDIAFFPAKTADLELMTRVNIKLIEDGVNALGGVMKGGLVYPNIENVVYVEWSTDGEGSKYLSRIGGWPPASARIQEIVDEVESEEGVYFTESDAPSDIKLVDYSDAGINPYDFLDLDRQ